MARSAWTTLALVSFGFSTLLAGCVVSSGSGGGAGFGGSGNSGGAATGGTAGAGTGGATGGSTSTGGSAGATTGGSAGAGPTVACNGGSTPLQTCDTTVSDTCMACLANKCCVPFAACYGTNPGDRCSAGGPTGTGEFQCMRDCVAHPTDAKYNCGASVLPYTTDAQQCCGSGVCNTPSCTGPLGDTTSALMTCINDATNGYPCATECGFIQ